MKNKLFSIFLFINLTGCGVSRYEDVNCKSTAYGQCDTSEAIFIVDKLDKKWKIEKNILYESDTKSGNFNKSEKHHVIDFVIENPQFVAIYDKKIDLVTVHRRVRDYQRGSKDLSRALLVFGSIVGGGIAGVPVAMGVDAHSKNSHFECSSPHINKYENLRKSIKTADEETKTDLQNQAIQQINLAFDCY